MMAMEDVTGAVMWNAADNTRVFIAGDGASVTRARAALHALVVPAATIDVSGAWGALVADGVHESVSHIVTRLIGHNAEKLIALGRASGAAIWAARDNSRLFIAGEPAAVARAREAVERVVVPGATIDVAAEWGTLVSDAGHTSLVAFTSRLLGRGGARVAGIQRETGAVIWVSGDARRLFVSGEPEAVRRARAKLLIDLIA
jgi:NADPH-dependent ferric siderophore reductase